MALAIGPCMFVAPLVPIALLIAIPLWPVALVGLAVMWLVTWPLERACRILGVRLFQGASATLTRWFRTVLTPWTFFDPPPAAIAPPDTGDAATGDAATGDAATGNATTGDATGGSNEQANTEP